MMTSPKKAVLAAVAAVFLALPASAMTVNVAQQNTNVFADASGKNAWYESVSYTVGGVGRGAGAGLFRLTGTDSTGAKTNFVAVCLEPLEVLRLPRLHTVGTTLGSATVTALSALLNNAMSLVNNAQSAAAFQIAAWEIANETNSGYDLKNGYFKMVSANSSTLALAQGWLNNIQTGQWVMSSKGTILSAANTQDLLTNIAPVPVPAAGLLMLGGIATLAGLRRRRKA